MDGEPFFIKPQNKFVIIFFNGTDRFDLYFSFPIKELLRWSECAIKIQSKSCTHSEDTEYPAEGNQNFLHK